MSKQLSEYQRTEKLKSLSDETLASILTMRKVYESEFKKLISSEAERRMAAGNSFDFHTHQFQIPRRGVLRMTVFCGLIVGLYILNWDILFPLAGIVFIPSKGRYGRGERPQQHRR